MKKSRLLKILLFICALFLLSFTAPLFAAQATNPSVTKISGRVTHSKEASDAEVDLKLDDSLEAGDRIKTYPKSSVDITFTEGNMIRLTENSSFVITKSELAAATPTVKLKLMVGNMFSVLKSFWGKDSYQIETPTAIVGTKGTVFLVKAEPEVTEVLVKEGKLGALNPEFPDKPVDVADGMKTVVEKGKFPTIPVAMTAAEVGIFSILSDIALKGGGATVTETAAAEAAGGTTAGDVALIGAGVAAGGAAAVYGADALVKSLDFDLEETHTYTVDGSESDLEDRYDVNFDDNSTFSKYKSYFDSGTLQWIKYEIFQNTGQGGTATFYMSEYQNPSTKFQIASPLSFSAGENRAETDLTLLDKDKINNLLGKHKFSVYVTGQGNNIYLKIKVTFGIRIKFKLL